VSSLGDSRSTSHADSALPCRAFPCRRFAARSRSSTRAAILEICPRLREYSANLFSFLEILKRLSCTESLLNYTITKLHNYQILPISGFLEFADFAFYEVALQGANVTDVELAVQVIGFVEEGAG
jgi:hypothetical protein